MRYVNCTCTSNLSPIRVSWPTSGLTANERNYFNDHGCEFHRATYISPLTERPLMIFDLQPRIEPRLLISDLAGKWKIPCFSLRRISQSRKANKAIHKTRAMLANVSAILRKLIGGKLRIFRLTENSPQPLNAVISCSNFSLWNYIYIVYLIMWFIMFSYFYFFGFDITSHYKLDLLWFLDLV